MVWQALSLPHQWHVMDALEQLRQSWYEAQASAAAGRGIHASTSAESSSIHSLGAPAAAVAAAIRGGRAMALFRVKTIKASDQSEDASLLECANRSSPPAATRRPTDRDRGPLV